MPIIYSILEGKNEDKEIIKKLEEELGLKEIECLSIAEELEISKEKVSAMKNEIESTMDYSLELSRKNKELKKEVHEYR